MLALKGIDREMSRSDFQIEHELDDVHSLDTDRDLTVF